MALPRASSEHSPSWQGHPHQGTDSCPIPQIRAPERRARTLGEWPGSRYFDPHPGWAVPPSLTAGSGSVFGAVGRPISKKLPLGALLSGGGWGGGQRPRGGETQPAPAAWEQEQLCGAVNNARGAAGVGSQGWGWGPVQPLAPSASVWPWSLRRGTHCSGGGGSWDSIQAPQWSIVCWPRRGGAAGSWPIVPHSLASLPAGQTLGSPGWGMAGSSWLGSPGRWWQGPALLETP